MTATCATHGAPSVATCARCGIFLCEQDVRPLDTQRYCAACVVRPDVDYLEAYRLQFFRKRKDGYSWLFGLWGALSLLSGSLSLGSLVLHPGSASLEAVLLPTALVTSAVMQLGWFSRQRWARLGLPVLTLVLAAVLLFLLGPLPALGAMLVPAAVVATAFVNVRSQLFFGLEVPRARLRRDWSLYQDNRIARTAATLGVAGLVVPVLPPIALLCGLVGLWRVNPTTVPPVGNKGAAIGGIVLGALGIVEWVLFLGFRG